MEAQAEAATPRSEGWKLTTGTLVAAGLAVCIGQVALAIPAVLNGLFQQDLGTSSSQLTWISDAFLVPVTLLELTFGVLGDLFGRKRLLIFGAAAICIGEIVSVLTPGAGTSTGSRVLVLWIGQAISGIGAAALFPTSLAMIAAGTRTAQERGRSIAIWAGALSSGNVLSPVLGGLVVRLSWGSDPTANWRWAFILVLALGLLSLGVTAGFARNSAAPEGRSLDWPGQVTIAVALFGLLFAIIQAPTAGWGSAEVILGFVVAAVFLVLFVMAERRSRAPLLRLELFSSRPFAVTAIVTVSGMFAMLGTAYATSVRLSSIQGFTPLKTSIAFLLLNGLTCAQVPFTMRILPKWNPRWMLVIGFALIAAGDFWLSTTTASNLSYGPIIPGLACVGIGFAFAISAVTSVAVNAVPVGLAGMASGATSLLRDFGFTLGPAIVGAVALSRAATTISQTVASHPAVQKALSAFYAAPAHAPPAQRASVAAAVGAVRSGPLGANAVPGSVPGPGGRPMPFNPLHDIAFHALDHAYKTGYVVCGGAAALSFVLAGVALGGIRRSEEPEAESAPGGLDAAPT
jgi:MFS family permease